MAIDSDIRNIISQSGYIAIDNAMLNVLSLRRNNHKPPYVNRNNTNEDLLRTVRVPILSGAMIAAWALDQWKKMGKPKNFIVLDLQIRNRSLKQDILKIAQHDSDFLNALDLYALDIYSYLMQIELDNTIMHKKEVKRISFLEQLPKQPMIFIAYEYLGVMPIKQYIKRKDKWFEVILIVDPLDCRIKFDTIELHNILQMQLLNEHQNAYDGAIIEESPHIFTMIKSLMNILNQFTGAGLVIDNGYDIDHKIRTRNQYHSTLRAIKHLIYYPVINSLGDAELRAQVDFYTLKQSLYQQGFSHNNYKLFTEKEFVLNDIYHALLYDPGSSNNTIDHNFKALELTRY